MLIPNLLLNATNWFFWLALFTFCLCHLFIGFPTRRVSLLKRIGYFSSLLLVLLTLFHVSSAYTFLETINGLNFYNKIFQLKTINSFWSKENVLSKGVNFVDFTHRYPEDSEKDCQRIYLSPQLLKTDLEASENAHFWSFKTIINHLEKDPSFLVKKYQLDPKKTILFCSDFFLISQYFAKRFSDKGYTAFFLEIAKTQAQSTLTQPPYLILYTPPSIESMDPVRFFSKDLFRQVHEEASLSYDESSWPWNKIGYKRERLRARLLLTFANQAPFFKSVNLPKKDILCFTEIDFQLIKFFILENNISRKWIYLDTPYNHPKLITDNESSVRLPYGWQLFIYSIARHIRTLGI